MNDNISIYVLCDEEGNIHLEQQPNGDMTPICSTSRAVLEDDCMDIIESCSYQIKEATINLI